MLRDQQIVYIGNDWFADNRTSSHQIARLLAQHNRMLYVEAAGQRAPTASKRDLSKIVAKLKKVWANPVRVRVSSDRRCNPDLGSSAAANADPPSATRAPNWSCVGAISDENP